MLSVTEIGDAGTASQEDFEKLRRFGVSHMLARESWTGAALILQGSATTMTRRMMAGRAESEARWVGVPTVTGGDRLEVLSLGHDRCASRNAAHLSAW